MPKFWMWAACLIVMVIALASDPRQPNEVWHPIFGSLATLGVVCIPIWGAADTFRRRGGRDMLPTLRRAKSEGYAPDLVIGGIMFDLDRRVLSVGDDFVPFADLKEWRLTHRDFDIALPTTITVTGPNAGTVNQHGIQSRRTGWYLQIDRHNSYDSLWWKLSQDKVASERTFNIFTDVMHGNLTKDNLSRLPSHILRRTCKVRSVFEGMAA